MILEELDPATRAVLVRYGFDPQTFERLRRAVASGELSPATNVPGGTVEPPESGDLTPLP